MSYDPQENRRQESPSGDLQQKSEKSVFGVIVHSFFVVPFLIAVFFVLLLAAVRILTAEKQNVYDHLNDVKVGGATKRWQAAFKLAQTLSQGGTIQNDDRFDAELIRIFEQTRDDDPRVRQYLALAMARLGKEKFVDPLISALKNEREENIYSIIYALGILKSQKSVAVISTFVDHPAAKIRSGAIAALGTIGDLQSINLLKKGLNDSEANVQWLSALSLATMKDNSGKKILIQLLDRAYLAKFPELDPSEQNDLMRLTIEAAVQLNDPQLNVLVNQIAQSDRNMEIRKIAFKNKQSIQPTR